MYKAVHILNRLTEIRCQPAFSLINFVAGDLINFILLLILAAKSGPSFFTSSLLLSKPRHPFCVGQQDFHSILSSLSCLHPLNGLVGYWKHWLPNVRLKCLIRLQLSIRLFYLLPFIGLLKLRFIACHVFILIVLFMRRFVSFSMLLRYFYLYGNLFTFYHKVKV